MKLLILFLLTFLSVHQVSIAQGNKRQQGFNLNDNHIAIEGYDPVAYFSKGNAVEGSAKFAVIHDGITYYFSSAQNKSEFLALPTKYEPQYGGWCAYAMGATGEKVTVDPKTFKITDGKLFLFYNKYFTNTLKSWNKDEKALHAKADVNWTRY